MFLHRAERDVMSYDHADVGGLLLKEWKLPRSLENAVMYHHRPNRATHLPAEAGITHIADLVTNALELGTSGKRLVPTLDAQAWEGLGLKASILGPMV